MGRKIVVLYHDKCHDGLVAAWIAKNWLEDSYERDLDDTYSYIPVSYGQHVPDEAWESNLLFILDFSYNRETMVKLAKGRQFRCIDHHKTAEKELAGMYDCTFNMDKSGARLTWEHFYGTAKSSPWLVDYVEDRDLWRWKLDRSREVNAYLKALPMTFEALDSLHEVSACDCFGPGATVIMREDRLIELIMSDAHECDLDGATGLACTSAVLQSEVAGKLAENYDVPYGCCYFRRRDGLWIYSLRSRSDFDVSELASVFGGGGHVKAAGFESKDMLI